MRTENKKTLQQVLGPDPRRHGVRSHTRGGGNPLKGLDPRHTTASGSNHRTPSSQATCLRRPGLAARGEITHPSREESPQGTRPPARDRKRVRSSDALLAADTLDHGTAGAPPTNERRSAASCHASPSWAPAAQGTIMVPGHGANHTPKGPGKPVMGLDRGPENGARLPSWTAARRYRTF